MTTFLRPAPSHADIAEFSQRVHRIAEGSDSVDAVLVEAARFVVAAIDPVAHAGVAVIVDARHHLHNAVAATSHVPTLFAAMENAHHEGPTRDALRRREMTVVHDFATEERWPTFRRGLAHDTAVQSCLVVPMTAATGELVGALTLYADAPGVFIDGDLELARTVATHTALAVAAVRRSIQFETALASRDVIGQAKGMVMERFSITAEQAFGLLTKLSQDSNIRVAEIAVRLIAREQNHGTHTAAAPVDSEATR